MQNIRSKGRWKVILTHGVRKLGKRGDVVEVKPGFFRKFLSRGFAVSYSDEQLKEIQTTLKSTFDEKHEHVAQEQKKKIDEKYLFFARQASGTDILFAAVSAKDIAKEIENSFQIVVNYKKIYIDDAIKKIGIYSVSIDLSEHTCITIFLAVGRTIEDAKKLVEELNKNTSK